MSGRRRARYTLRSVTIQYVHAASSVDGGGYFNSFRSITTIRHLVRSEVWITASEPITSRTHTTAAPFGNSMPKSTLAGSRLGAASSGSHGSWKIASSVPALSWSWTVAASQAMVLVLRFYPGLTFGYENEPRAGYALGVH